MDGAEGFLFVSCLCAVLLVRNQGAFLLAKAFQFGNSGWEVELTEKKIFPEKLTAIWQPCQVLLTFPMMESTFPCPFLSWVLKVIVRCYSIRPEKKGTERVCFDIA